MSTVEKLIQKNQVVETIEDREYVCYRFTAATALEALGPGALAVVQDGPAKGKTAVKVKDGAAAMRKLLKVLMIHPSLGEKDDLERGVVSWLTLGDDAGELFTRLTKATTEKAANFPESSEDQKEP